jgi:ADP-ribose pyrophosphatase YjhB (NUDIX family)
MIDRERFRRPGEACVSRVSTIEQLKSSISDARRGLPEDVFLLVSELTPLVNVDLLIKDDTGRTLLTWRDDRYYEPGWHVPGGIVRFKERLEDRVRAVALTELGAAVEFSPAPIAINEVIRQDFSVRGHFISLLYSCVLVSPPDDRLSYDPTNTAPGQWAWHTRCPDNILAVQEIYRAAIDTAPSFLRVC